MAPEAPGAPGHRALLILLTPLMIRTLLMLLATGPAAPPDAAGSPGPMALLLCIVLVMDWNIPSTRLNLGCNPSCTVSLVLGSV